LFTSDKNKLIASL